MSLLSIVTPSFNKPEYVLDAVNSVLNQTFRKFEYWIIDNSTDGLTRPLLRKIAGQDPRIQYLEFDFTPLERRQFYVPAYILNQLYPELESKYVFYLSDDDILLPQAIQLMFRFLETTNYYVCYHTMQRQTYQKGRWIEQGNITANRPVGKNTQNTNVDCYLDGGQIMHRTDCLKQLDYPYFYEEHAHAPHSDGLFLQKLAQLWTFYPVPETKPLSIHRITPKSTWTRA